MVRGGGYSQGAVVSGSARGGAGIVRGAVVSGSVRGGRV